MSHLDNGSSSTLCFPLPVIARSATAGMATPRPHHGFTIAQSGLKNSIHPLHCGSGELVAWYPIEERALEESKSKTPFTSEDDSPPELEWNE